MKSFVKFFTSVRLAIILLIILTAASVVGTLIPQGRSVEEYAARYGQLSGLFIALQFTRLYHSIWYLAVLGLFAVNITICTISRLFPKFRRALHPHVLSDPKGLSSLPIKERLKMGGPRTSARAGVVGALSSARYRVFERDEASRTHLLGRKKIWGLFGSDVVHIGLLIILAGGIVSGTASVRAEIALNEGEAKPAPGGAFNVRLDKFDTEYYPDGSVKAWKSTLTVLSQNQPVLTRVVQVNRPLSYKGFSFYQTSYGWNWDNPTLEVWVKKKSDPAFLQKLKVRLGESVPLGDKESLKITVKRFIPDFVLGENNQPELRSLQPNNPAALVEGSRGPEQVFSGWIFANFPDFARMHGADKKETDLSFELKGFQAPQYSVLEAAKDPGAILIWIGSALVMLGLGLAFYWPTWEIRAVLEEIQGKTEVIAGGIAAKSRESFAAEFERIMSALRRQK